MLDAATTLAVPLTALAVFAGTLFSLSLLGALRPAAQSTDTGDAPTVFLFEGVNLIDASPAAEEILGRAQHGRNDWARMLAALAQPFPGLARQLSEIDSIGTVGLRSTDGTEQLIATSLGTRIRITLSGANSEHGRISIDAIMFRAMLREIETLRLAASGLPFPVWRQTRAGEIVWANQAFLDSVDAGPDTAPGIGADWPPSPLFETESIASIIREGNSRRLQPRIAHEGVGARWYECRATQAGDDYIFTAVGIDTAVQAERQLRDFMQTLTKTFSHLPTGLAIFDRHRHLAMFNPALSDLTGLPVDFLAARPSLYSFLDRLRDRRMIPEPKDYGSWRRQIFDLESAALDGTYSETWSLPDNRTYKVTGRPHHGGAMAFLLEDISTEVTLTRRFRTELELGQAVIDALQEAVVVFSPAGNLSMVNTAYQVLWDSDVGDTVDLPTVTELSRHWMARGASPVWGEIRDFVLHTRDRSAWDDIVTLPGGDMLHCRVAPLAGGSTMVSFRALDPAEVPLEPPRKRA